jgi:phosphohistidine phosphatase
MKYLTVIRHAKSSWAQPGLSDHDRPLNERGQRAAPAVASFMQRTYFDAAQAPALLPAPDALISSTALRATATAQSMREVFGLPPASLRLDSRLYLASAQRLLEVVRELDESWQHALLFGHNPGLLEFAERILVRAHVPRMPTCSAVILALPHAYWGLADWGEAQLIGYLTPRAIERRFPELYAGISQHLNSGEEG